MDDTNTNSNAAPGAAPGRRHYVVAIDGPAASGKGTLARRLATHFGFAHLDTGLLYRATGLKVLEAGGDPSNRIDAWQAARSLDLGDTRHADIRSDRAARAGSQVAAIPEVRAALLGFQRNFTRNPPGGRAGSVLDGRDIGTVVCPGADAKLFVTADVQARAERRLRELLGQGLPAIYEDVLADMKERDARDTQRAAAPLRPAADAFVLDTSSLDADEAFEAALTFICSRTGLPRG